MVGIGNRGASLTTGRYTTLSKIDGTPDALAAALARLAWPGVFGGTITATGSWRLGSGGSVAAGTRGTRAGRGSPFQTMGDGRGSRSRRWLLLMTLFFGRKIRRPIAAADSPSVHNVRSFATSAAVQF